MTGPLEAASRELVAADGHRIVALRYAPGTPARARIVVGGATAVPQHFYRRFAQHAVARGFDVTTVDYRGIGLSAPASLAGFEVDYLDWARQDLAAAIDSVPDDGRPLFMVGHSFGGHAFGLLPNHHRVARFVTFATGAGWHGWMPWRARLRVLSMWHLIGPLATRWSGYLPARRLGLGEDLPLSVYTQWRHWCGFPNYFFDDPAMRTVHAEFARVRTPIVAVNALDDAWAPPGSRDVFMRGYSRTAWHGVDVAPRSIDLRAIGHMGYFRPTARRLWDTTLDWFGAADADPGAFTVGPRPARAG